MRNDSTNDVMILKNPEKYQGFAKHPTEDKTIRKVVKATITKCKHLSSWYDLKIEFEGGFIFLNSSGSIRGCKQMFAFQCSAGSKWVNQVKPSMKYIRTENQRSSAIERLKQNKEKCNQYNFFGHDNHLHIDIMIDVIDNERSEDWIYNQYPSCDENGSEDPVRHAKWSAAINARDYLRGDIEVKSILYPEH